MFYVWADALLAYLTGIGYADPEREGRVRAPLAHSVPLRGQRHHPLPLRDLARDAHGRRPAHHATRYFGHGFLLVGGEKMSKSKGNGIKPADSVEVFGVDAYRYYFMSDVRSSARMAISPSSA